MSPSCSVAATGHRAQEIRLRNTSQEPCRLAPYPDLAFNDTGGNAMGVFINRGGSFMTDDPGASTIVVVPGASAHAFLGWDAVATAGQAHAGTLLAAPYAGTERRTVAVDFDITHGGAVAVTAWTPVSR